MQNDAFTAWKDGENGRVNTAGNKDLSCIWKIYTQDYKS